MHKVKFTIIFLVLCSTRSASIFAQNSIGVATGNYGGVSSLWFNPSSIVDSRYKFQINLISVNSYLDNNLFEVKRDAVTGRRFFKEPYNKSFSSVRNDLLALTPASSTNAKVNMLIDNRVQFPASMMISLGRKSAIAINLQSRIGLQAFDINRNTAQLLYNELRDSTQYGMMQDNSGFGVNYLRWQEVGLTYGTVLINRKAHFLKAAFTGKWLMGQSGARIQSDNAKVQFNSATQMSLQSPLMRYYRSDNADIRFLSVQSFFKDIQDNRFGWDAGITYEFRGKFNKFKYVGEDYEVKERQDMNKYALRLGVAIVDVGKFTFKKQPLTNDHSANFNNFNFANVKAQSFSDFDTAYSKQVQYAPNSSPTFDIGLPTAISANIDLHVFGGFYLNGALYTPLSAINKSTNALRVAKWYAVTPRFETSGFGLYIPVVATPLNKRTSIGATLRLGPLYIGSSNLGSYVFNDRLSAIDVHAGLRLGITYGRPSKIFSSFQRLIKSNPLPPAKTADTSAMYAEYRGVIDSIRSLPVKTVKPDEVRSPLVNVIVNNYLNGSVPAPAQTQYRNADTLVFNNAVPVSKSLPVNQRDSALQRRDAQIDYLLRRAAENELRIRQLEQKRIADSTASANRPTSRTSLTSPSAQPATTKIQQTPQSNTDSLSSSSAQPTTAKIQPVPQSNTDSSSFRSAQPATTKVQPAPQSNTASLPSRSAQPATTTTQPVPQSNTAAFSSRSAQPANTTIIQPAPQRNRRRIVEVRESNRRIPPTVVTVQQPNNSNQAHLNRIEAQNSDLEAEVRRLRAEMNASANAPGTAVADDGETVNVAKVDAGATPIVSTATDTLRLTDTLVLREPYLVLDTSTVPRVQPANTKVKLDYDPVYFASASIAISPAARRVLEHVVEDYKRYRFAEKIHLTGRTDSMGSEELNRQLAQKRIDAVTKYLVDNGVPAQQLTFETMPDLTSKPRRDAEERRVDIDLISTAVR